MYREYNLLRTSVPTVVALDCCTKRKKKKHIKMERKKNYRIGIMAISQSNVVSNENPWTIVIQSLIKLSKSSFSLACKNEKE